MITYGIFLPISIILWVLVLDGLLGAILAVEKEYKKVK